MGLEEKRGVRRNWSVWCSFGAVPLALSFPLATPSKIHRMCTTPSCPLPLPSLFPPPPTLVVFKFNLGILKLLGAAWGFETQGSPLRPMACSRHTVTGVWSRWVVGRAGRVGLVFLFVCFYPFYLTLCFFPPLFFFS